MPVRRSPLFDVPEEDAEVVLQEVAVRAAARKKAQVRTYDPELGETYEEAEQELDKIRADVGRYGEYVYGLKPAAVHSLWNKVADDVINRRVEHATFFRHIYKGNVCDKNVKIGKGNFKVIGIYYWNEKMMGGYIKGLVRVNNEPNNLWWFGAQGVTVDNHTPSDFKMYMHKGDAEAYQDPTTIAFSRTRY